MMHLEAYETRHCRDVSFVGLSLLAVECINVWVKQLDNFDGHFENIESQLLVLAILHRSFFIYSTKSLSNSLIFFSCK